MNIKSYFRLNHLAILCGCVLSFTLGCSNSESDSALKKSDDTTPSKSESSSDASAVIDEDITNENISFSGSTKVQIRKYQELIAKRQDELNFLRNSEDKLSKLILLDSNKACFLSENISSLEIKIGGGRAPDRDHGRKSDKRSSQGNPDNLVINFGNDITLSVDGNGFFDSKKHTTGDLASKKVADLSKISFQKNGIKYSNKRVCERNGGFLGIGSSEKCRYEISEENIWSLSEVEIKVNGVIIYKRGDISHDFDGTASEWKDSNLKSNTEYIKMLGKDDCA